MKQDQFEVFSLFVGICSLFLLAGIITVGALVMESIVTQSLTFLLAATTISWAIGLSTRGYNRRIWVWTGVFDTEPFDERVGTIEWGEEI